jgi:hypothetical protein
MHGDRRALAVASAAIVLSVASVPGLAQSNAVRWRTATSELTLRLAPAGVSTYVESDTSTHVVAVPENLTVVPTYRETVESMIERSPAFRRQCMRIAAAAHLSVVVRIKHPLSAGPRARTQITRADEGRLIAAVEIDPFGDFMELLAHELEHVIEQLDGIDLAAKANIANSGVHSCAEGFETRRAVRVGTLVALEARGGR